MTGAKIPVVRISLTSSLTDDEETKQRMIIVGVQHKQDNENLLTSTKNEDFDAATNNVDLILFRMALFSKCFYDINAD